MIIIILQKKKAEERFNFDILIYEKKLRTFLKILKDSSYFLFSKLLT